MSNYKKTVWKDSPETEITAERLNNMEEGIFNAHELLENRSHIGQYIFSSTLDTMEKVIAIYGGKTWERVYGRFLFGADDSHQVGDIGGEETHALTVDEMPSHSHGIPHGYSGATPAELNISYSDNMKTGTHQPTTSAGGNQPHNNMPPYEVVYIWKRVV